MHRNRRHECQEAYLHLCANNSKQQKDDPPLLQTNEQETTNKSRKRNTPTRQGQKRSRVLNHCPSVSRILVAPLPSIEDNEILSTVASDKSECKRNESDCSNNLDSLNDDDDDDDDSNSINSCLSQSSSGKREVFFPSSNNDSSPGENHETSQADGGATQQQCDTNTDPDNSLLKLYNDINSELHMDHNLHLNKFSTQEMVQVDLLRTLKRLKAPLKTFKEVLDWADRANVAGYHFSAGVPTRQILISKLQEMTHLSKLKPQAKKLQLPHSKKVVEIVYFNANAIMSSFLSCPLLNRDENYLFNGNSPTNPPNPKPNFIGDLNTSANYIQTHALLIKNPGKEVLLPCVLAMDKTHIDTYGRLRMEPVTISYGLMKHSIRSSPIAMRILGYINHYTRKDDDESQPANDVTEAEEPISPSNTMSKGAQNANDYHAQIHFILEQSGFLELQRRGFNWIIHFQGNTFPVTFRMYVPFIIGDTEGHDQLCGHYKCRTGSVAQLCRACVCPTKLCGWSKAKFKFRMSATVDRMISNQKTDELQAMSLHSLRNGFRNVQFGSSHNKRGIFGACPGETLHLVLLGWFKYVIEAFVAQAGAHSNTIQQYDSLCARVGDALCRQSDRDMPRTHFPSGFCATSNFMAEEMPGCLLVMLFTFHTSRYREIFSSRSKFTDEMGLGNIAHITDWITLITSLLQWHAWLKQDTIAKALVNKSRLATKWLMRQFKFIAPRPTGMKNNTIKFHLVLHLADDILDHGVPENFNSSFAESAHITLAKDTSRNTQKRVNSFTLQSANRYVENLTIGRAWHEICPTTPPTRKHGSILPTPIEEEEENAKWGKKFLVFKDQNGNVQCKWARKKDGGRKAGAILTDHALQFLVKNCLPNISSAKLICYTHYKNPTTGDCYRAHPKFMGQPWYDFAMVRWNSRFYPQLPARIHTFVDLTNLIPGRLVHNRENNQPAMGCGLYALIESFEPIPQADLPFSNDLIGRYYRTEIAENNKYLPRLYLVDIHSILSPLTGIKDIPARAPLPAARRRGPRVAARRERGDVEARNNMEKREEYLFLMQRRCEWASCWDTVIRNLHHHKSEEDGGETTEPEDNIANTTLVD